MTKHLTDTSQAIGVVLVSIVVELVYVFAHKSGQSWPPYLQETLIMAVLAGSTFLIFSRGSGSRSLRGRFGVSLMISAAAGLVCGALLTAYVLGVDPGFPAQVAQWSVRDLGPNATGGDSAGAHLGASLLYAPYISIVGMVLVYTTLGVIVATGMLIAFYFRERPA